MNIVNKIKQILSSGQEQSQHQSYLTLELLFSLVVFDSCFPVIPLLISIGFYVVENVVIFLLLQL